MSKIRPDSDGVRLVQVSNGSTTTQHYVGDWYEKNVTTNTPTVYYPFNGVPVALKQGSTLYYLHHDQVGSLVSLTDASAKEVASLRYFPYGGLRTLTFANGYSTLPTDRLFTGQTRDTLDTSNLLDSLNDRFYWGKSRYYDATIGRFQSADSVVPDPKSPQALNRYAYVLNNPLRFVDPSGHDSWDPNWVATFEAAHNGQAPTQQDWVNYQFSLSHAGSGPNGAWTSEDWDGFNSMFADSPAVGATQPENSTVSSLVPALQPDQTGTATPGQTTNVPPVLVFDLPPNITLQQFQREVARQLKIVDRSAGSGGGRLFHLDYDPQHGWHFNADLGPLSRYNHMSLGEAAYAYLSDATAGLASVTIPAPPVLPWALFESLNPYAPSDPVMD